MNETMWFLTIIGSMFFLAFVLPLSLEFAPHLIGYLKGLFIPYEIYKVKSHNTKSYSVGYDDYLERSVILEDRGALIEFESSVDINSRILKLQNPNKDHDVYISAKLDMKNFRIIKIKTYHLKRKEEAK